MPEVIRITHGEPKIQSPKWEAGRTINEGDDVWSKQKGRQDVW